MQRVIENDTTVLRADEGMFLTDGESTVTTVILGKDADGTEWHEITEEEAVAEDATVEDYQAALREMGVDI